MNNKIIIRVFIAVIFLVGLYIVVAPSKKNEVVTYNETYTWYVDFDQATKENVMVRGKNIDLIKDNPRALIAALNGSDRNPEAFRTPEDREPNDPPKVKLLKIEQATAFVEVVNAEYLTQRMGTTGAQDYLASATYTLTEDPAIKRVYFIFEEGDHAIPGGYERSSFTPNYKIVAGKQ